MMETRGDRRERQRLKRRYGMALHGRSVLLLARQIRGEGARVGRARRRR